MSAKDVLLGFVHGEWDDDGGACDDYKQALTELAGSMDLFEDLGFAINVRCFPSLLGSVIVSIEREGRSMEIFSEYFERIHAPYTRGVTARRVKLLVEGLKTFCS